METEHDYDLVVTYARFSDPNQGKGMSLERQRETLAKEVAAMGLAAVPYREIADEGRSGYHGHHRTHGKFGDFEAEVLRGEHIKTLFLCECLDRFSREGHDAAYDLLKSFVRNGVSVKTLDGDFYKAGQPITLVQVITSHVKFDLATDESAKKAKRSSDNWARLRRKAKTERLALTKLVPPWIIVNEDRTMELDPARSTLVERMFVLADKGMGSRGIANLFTEKGIKPWPRFDKRTPKIWEHSNISRILTNRAVIGEFHPNVKGKPCLEGPWLNHFPPVVSVDLFNRVRTAAPQREAVRGGAKSAEVQNLFSNLARCECCGNKLAYVAGRKEGVHYTKGGKVYSYKRPNGSLVCRIAYNKGDCQNRTYLAYLTFEDAVLDMCLHLALDDGSFARKDEVARLNTTVAERERALEVATERAESLWRAFSTNPSTMKEKLAQEAEEEATSLGENLKALRRQRESARGRVSSHEHLARVAGVRANLYSNDLAERRMIRLKIAQSLRAVITDMRVNSNKETTIVIGNGLGIIRIDGKGRVLSPVMHGMPVLHRKEYQLAALNEIDPLEGPRNAIIERAERRSAQLRASRK